MSMRSPAITAFTAAANRGASARGKRPVFNPNRDISPERNRFDLGRSLTKGNTVNASQVEKVVTLENAIAAAREYQKGLPLAKKRGATGTKVARILADLEQLADRVAAR